MKNQFLRQYQVDVQKDEENGKTNSNFKKKSFSKNSKFTKWQIIYLKMGENKPKAAAEKYKSQKTLTIGPRKNNRMIYLNQAAPAFRKIKQRRKMERAQQSGK